MATDLSESATLALRRAAQLAEQHQATVTALYVAKPKADQSMVDFAADILRKQVREHVGAVQATCEVVAGSPSAEIVFEADHRQADLIVVGAHGRHWPRDLLVGSTAESVVREGPCPVLVVNRPTEAAYSTVLLAVDDSPQARLAAQAGILLTSEEAHYVLAHSELVIGEHLMRMRGADEKTIESLRAVQLAEAKRQMEGIAAELGVSPEVLVESGRPEERIPELAHRCEADLVVVGTHGMSGPRHTLLGSVAQHVLRRASCDVLVVRRRTRPWSGSAPSA